MPIMPLVSKDALRALDINPDVAREALVQAERRLADALETKKGFEQKASTFFSVYVALALALFGVGGTLYKANAAMSEVLPFLIVGFGFMAGALSFALALKDKLYGELGTTPDRWLQVGTINGDERVLPLMQADLLHDYVERISTSRTANSEKANLIAVGIWVGFGATALLLGLAFYR